MAKDRVEEDVNTNRCTLKLSVAISGRSTPGQLHFAHVENVA
jgi:transcription antitermination factor NusG